MAEIKVRRFGLKSWVAAYEGATICFHGKGRTKDHALGALWLDIWNNRAAIERESLVTWLDDVYDAYGETEVGEMEQ